MNPLREVIAKFSVLVDDAGVDQLGKKIDKLKGSYGALALGATAALGMAAAASFKFIQASSGVTETQNKIEALFGKGSRAEIIAWSKTVEAQMGRSEYAFQQTFSDFAAFLDPLGLGEEKVTSMSKELAKLKVDLASFYNTSEEDAGMRLFSGMAGETEAVRRLGIDISDTALANLYNSKDNPLDPKHQAGKGAHGNNRGKGLASMTLQDKALLRHKKIIMDTKKAQGDASRTAGGWANTLKRLTDRFFRLEVAMGKLMEKGGTKFLNLLESLVGTAEKVATKSKGLQTAISMLGAAAVLWTGRWALANTALLASLAPIAAEMAVITAAFLVIEDFWTFFSDVDAETGLGKMLTMLTGVKTPLVAVEELFSKIELKAQKTYDWIRKWVPVIGQFLRAAESLNGGRGFWDDTASDTSGMGADAYNDKRTAARNKALESGDINAFVKNRKKDETSEEAAERFKKQRPWFVNNGISKPMEEDYNNPYQTGLTAPSKAGGGAMMTGAVTVAPVVHNHLHGTNLTIGDVEVATKRVLKEATQTAAQALSRRGSK
jgi:hypothetical protein